MAQNLPRFIAICNDRNQNYLHQVYSAHQPQVNGFLRFSGEEVINPHAKFEVEPAEIGNGLVHIRCCYNNKYWACRQNQNWIIAEANEKVEDQTSWGCTLFRPHVISGTKIVRLHNIFHNQIVRCYLDAQSPRNNCLYAGMPTQNNMLSDILMYTNWDSLSIMPKHIAIKGDNESYLGFDDDGIVLQFNCENRDDVRVRHQVFTTPNGSIRIKSGFNEKFWTLIPDKWIAPQVVDVNTDINVTLFQVTRINNNTIALRNLVANKFCRRHTEFGFVDGLQAGSVPDNHIVEETKLHVEELVISRKINSVDFKRSHARVNEEYLVPLHTQTWDNSSEEPRNHVFQFTHTYEENRTWNASVSWKLGVNTEIRARIPYIDENLLVPKLSDDEVEFEYQWGDTMPDVYEVQPYVVNNVQPMNRVIVSLEATKVTCDIPFSYTQSDTLMINGQEVVVNEDMHDGLYTFTNIFNFQYDTVMEPIPAHI